MTTKIIASSCGLRRHAARLWLCLSLSLRLVAPAICHLPLNPVEVLWMPDPSPRPALEGIHGGVAGCLPCGLQHAAMWRVAYPAGCNTRRCGRLPTLLSAGARRARPRVRGPRISLAFTLPLYSGCRATGSRLTGGGGGRCRVASAAGRGKLLCSNDPGGAELRARCCGLLRQCGPVPPDCQCLREGAANQSER